MASASSELFVYGLADPRTDVIHYIGKSKTGLRRPRRHGVGLINDPNPKGAWVRGLVAEGVQFRIIVMEEASRAEDLDALECFWIAQGRALGWPLTNVTKGGKGWLGGRQSESAKRRIGQANSHPHTEEHRNKNREGLKRHWASGARGAEYLARLSQALKGRAPAAAFMKRTPEWKANMSRAQKERRQREREAREAGSCR
jgi:hypothetical protein